MSAPGENRRPLKTRSRIWAQKIAAFLAKTHSTPNQISVISTIVALAGATLLLMYPSQIGLIGCAICIQLRLLCNLLDGMVAIEGGKQSPLGILYNEFPDRIADSLFIIALGYAISIPWIGWFGALSAMGTAYVRVFGGSLGLPQDFRGPMAKQHRMAVMTLGCVLGAIELTVFGTNYALIVAAYSIAFGAVITCITRTLAIAERVQRS